MSSKVEKQLIWHPRQENRFIVGGGSQINLYEWAPDVPEFRLLTSSEVLNMKCFAWSSDPHFDDLVAIGMNSGKIDLVRLEATKVAKNLSIGSGVVGHISTRNGSSSKACNINALSFSTANSSLLAVGSDKVRGDASFVVWDVGSISGTASNTKLGSASIVYQHSKLGDVVTSVSFLPDTPDIVAAGVAGSSIRLFDLRTSSEDARSAAQVQSKVDGFAVDPFNPGRFASYGEGTVSVWDSRSLSQPLLAFTSKDASADGARFYPSDVFSSIEFSTVRSGVLATLLRDANHVRLWNLKNAPPMTESAFESNERYHEAARETSRTRKISRMSWTTPANILPWAAQTEHPISPAMSERTNSNSNNTGSVVLANTYKTKSYNRSIMSFALVPSQQKAPLTSKIVLVKQDGDIEMHSMFDAPKHTAWSPRGDLAIGVGGQYTLVGNHDTQPVVEPWEINMNDQNGHSGRDDKSLDRRSAGKTSRPHSRAPSPGFGRGDKDGFPALISSNGSRTKSGPSSSPVPEKLQVAGGLSSAKDQQTPESPSTGNSPTSILPTQRIPSSSKSQKIVAHANATRGRRRVPHWNIPAFDTDVTLTMRTRVLQGYGMSNVPHSIRLVEKSDADHSALSDVWKWINHSRSVLSLGPGSRVNGIDFAYQGVLGIWEGLETSSTPEFTGQRDSLDLAGTSGSPPLSQGELSPGLDLSSTVASPFFSTRSSSADAQHGNYIAALNELNSQSEAQTIKGMWKPTVHSAKLQHRKLALALVNFKIGDEEIARWEKEGKQAQAACWLLFTNQGARAIDILMRSKSEAHQMMSGTLAVLLQSGSSSKNHEMQSYCEKLVNRLQDPHFRILVSYVVFNDWSDVMEEQALPMRERLAIALRFLDDKTLTSYLKRLAEDCRKHGNIEGLLVTGLTPRGLDILQSYVDMTSDVQTAAMLSSFVCPGRSHDIRAERWLDSYHDLLDGWKLFHHRCQFDIDRGKLLQDDINAGDVLPMEWVKKQFLIKCNFCSKIVNSRRIHEPGTTQRRRATSCPWCGRALPRCSVCLMSVGIIPDSSRENDQLHPSFRDTLDDAFVFCQACRHGGHAAHIIEWFFGDGDESRPRRTCPVADCDCFCDQEY